jgi:ubiquinone/menaquinone biosynthesis C-methylase UbiE
MSYDQLFSKQAAEYARFRPSYPDSLFDYLASVAVGKNIVWDCGTGNGQVALMLANHFDVVIATDVNPNQIQNAFLHPKISYKVARAEHSELEPRSIDLVTVGNALH